jgi:hypothetical protein
MGPPPPLFHSLLPLLLRRSLPMRHTLLPPHTPHHNPHHRTPRHRSPHTHLPATNIHST